MLRFEMTRHRLQASRCCTIKRIWEGIDGTPSFLWVDAVPINWIDKGMIACPLRFPHWSSPVAKATQDGHCNMSHEEPESDTQQSPYVIVRIHETLGRKFRPDVASISCPSLFTPTHGTNILYYTSATISAIMHWTL